MSETWISGDLLGVSGQENRIIWVKDGRVDGYIEVEAFKPSLKGMIPNFLTVLEKRQLQEAFDKRYEGTQYPPGLVISSEIREKVVLYSMPKVIEEVAVPEKIIIPKVIEKTSSLGASYIPEKKEKVEDKPFNSPRIKEFLDR